MAKTTKTPKKGKITVPLGPSVRRRLRVAERLVEYIAANVDRAGTVHVPAGTIVAHGSAAAITAAEIGVFVERFRQVGKLTDVEGSSDGYRFKLARSPAAPRRNHAAKVQSVAVLAMPRIDAMMRAVLSAVAGGAKRHGAVRTEAAKALGFPDAAAMEQRAGDSFDRRIGLCLETHKARGYIDREGKAISILLLGRARLMDGRPFKDDEVPKKFRLSDRSSAPARHSPAATAARAEKLLPTIPSLPPERLRSIWANAVKILADPGRAAEHGSAREVIEAVESAWDMIENELDEEFAWPSTEARRGKGTSSLPEMQDAGMLSYLEYRVGKTAGLPSSVRQAILSRVFEGKLPRVFRAQYMEEWGTPQSARRLRKMAESLAAFARLAKQNDEERRDEAIRQWEQDLEFLHDRYYVGRFGFGWPTALIAESGPPKPGRR